jgi:2-iminobutanoate/2-iminopropanoate deaminase
MTRETITTDKIAPPLGPYSAAVRADNLVFLSGQVALDPTSRQLIAGDTTAQTERILRNIAAVLEAAGKSFTDVVTTSVFLTDMKDFAAMNAVYARYSRRPSLRARRSPSPGYLSVQLSRSKLLSDEHDAASMLHVPSTLPALKDNGAQVLQPRVDHESDDMSISAQSSPHLDRRDNVGARRGSGKKRLLPSQPPRHVLRVLSADRYDFVNEVRLP